jgi:flagellar assembly protein FliH
LSAERRILGDAARVREASFPSFEPATPAPRPAATPAPVPASAAKPAPDEPAGRRLAAEAERARAEAFAAGLRQGHDAAYAEWNGKLAALATSLESVARALIAHRVELAAEVERQFPRLLELLVRRVLRQELASSETAARTVIRGLAERLAGCDRPVVVRVAPGMVDELEAWRRSAQDGPAMPSVRIEADPALAGGDWLIDTGEGFLDGRVESQLQTAWQLLSELSS